MRILYTSDIHANPGHLRSMVEASLAHRVESLIIGGDIIPHDLPLVHGTEILNAQAGYVESMLIPTLRKLRDRMEIRIYLDLGNDDFVATRPLLEAHDGELLQLLHMRKYALTGEVDLMGYMMVPPTPFTRKDWEKPDCRERPYSPGSHFRLDGFVSHSGRMEEITLDSTTNETIAADLAVMSTWIDGPFIFVSHCPPHGTSLDVLWNGSHAGSVAIRQFIERWSREGRLVAACHGHIHEAPSVSGSRLIRINNTPCINPGQEDTFQYAILELGSGRGAGKINIEFPQRPSH